MRGLHDDIVRIGADLWRDSAQFWRDQITFRLIGDAESGMSLPPSARDEEDGSNVLHWAVLSDDPVRTSRTPTTVIIPFPSRTL